MTIFPITCIVLSDGCFKNGTILSFQFDLCFFPKHAILTFNVSECGIAYPLSIEVFLIKY